MTIPFAHRPLIAALGIAALAAAARPEFEVASVKPSPIDARGFRFAPLSGGRLNVRNNNLQNLMVNAYDVRPFQILGIPSSMDSERYDVDAKASGNATREEMMQMLQALLEYRFRLKLHRETRDLPVYVLTVAKSGLKLPPWKEGGCVSYEPNQPRPATPGQVGKACGNNIVGPKGPNMEWTAFKIDMVGFTRVLSSLLAHKVIDRTGVTESFDLHFEYRPDENLTRAADSAEPGENVPSLFTVLQEQLGLKLESSKAPVEVLVVDHVERPSAN